jgi:4-diphosphocytidyl-2-C-methyl-D-erythritol kinase
MNLIKLRAYAKINLGLDVVRRREDGYHEVKMIMQTIGLYDKLIINILDNPSIKVTTNLHYLPVDENNLVYKAAAMMREQYGLEQGILINLEKKIPVAAGLAGGSSDAAATLHGINKLFKLKLTKEELMKLGVRLGADVPYCILRGTALSEGIGEVLTPLKPFPSCHVLLVKPPINVSTKYVYENLHLDTTTKHPDIDGIITHINKNDLYSATKLFDNLLETVTTNDYPIINEIKADMIKLGAITSLMSGSGPTVFGIFDDYKKAKDAFYHFKSGDIGKQIYLTHLFNPQGKNPMN